MISAATQLCMVIGDPIGHSLSPALHNAGYRAAGLADKFVYVACQVHPDAIGDFMAGMRALGIRGVSCTMPHKEIVIPYLDEVDPVARQIGAVNTVVQEHGRLVGYNTDWIGTVAPLQLLTTLSGKRAAVIGAGGAAKAMVYGLTQAGAQVTVYNRTYSRALAIAEQFGCGAAGLDNQQELASADIICNATPVGMGEQLGVTPVKAKYLHAGQIILDAIYHPRDTRLLTEAREQGAAVVPGAEMLLYQAMAQFALYTGREAPEEAMRKVLYAR